VPDMGMECPVDTASLSSLYTHIHNTHSYFAHAGRRFDSGACKERCGALGGTWRGHPDDVKRLERVLGRCSIPTSRIDRQTDKKTDKHTAAGANGLFQVLIVSW
jgi:hypothetical protein